MVAPQTSPRVSPVVTHFANDDVVVCTWKAVLISIWKRDHRVTYAQARGAAGEVLARNNAGPLALFTLVLETGLLPDEPTRDALAKVRLAPCFQRVVACAGIAEGDPLRAAALRSVSIDLDQRARPPFPTRMFGSRLDAAEWVVDRLKRAGDTSIRANEFLGVIADLVR
ncbi:MAG TPA: hypothetical protein VGI39_35045 [Polyangiaceae bacterium]|jgi:hypothetical protein